MLKPIWHKHPTATSGEKLGDRAAGVLKHWFGTWTILGFVAAFIVFWMLKIKDPGWLHLNLILSCMAAVQGIILQISANRGDAIASRIALETHEYAKHMNAELNLLRGHFGLPSPGEGIDNAS